MTNTRESQVRAWFDGLNAGDITTTADLFAANHSIKNAANPTITGPDASHSVLVEFLERTTSRHFEIHTIAHGEHVTFAHWTGELTFRDGANVAGETVNPFTVRITGIDTFTFDEQNNFTDVQIIHQTTTVAAAAAAHAKNGSAT